MAGLDLPPGAALLVSQDELSGAITALAGRLNDTFADLSEPAIVLTVMNGGLVFTGQLLPQLRFSLQCDYLHATRYGADNIGGDRPVVWKKKPNVSLRDRVVIVLDDILDEGVTAAAIRALCDQLGAKQTVLVMMVAKPSSCRRVAIEADYVALNIPNEYVFGFGMDYSGLYRNLPALYFMMEEAVC